jgi:hypothetical protein
MTNLELSRAAANMLSSLEIVLQRELLSDPNQEESRYLKSLIDRVPIACFMLGVAAGKLDRVEKEQ